MGDAADWKGAWRSFYYEGAPDAPDPVLLPGRVALLVIDVQNTYLDRPDPAALAGAELARFHAWTPFHERMRGTVIPAIRRLFDRFRADGNPVLFARIACLRPDGADRSLSQKTPGWNNILLPHHSAPRRSCRTWRRWPARSSSRRQPIPR
ncbi:MAG TPA: hypothetical protein VGN83_18695 [Falsiroseomonas sp.]|jgi:nicotinamidase-related amidase|nr:hypothetical protein [Falsiroseomonas sp.]